jgi:hypothetical protein
MPVKKWTLLDQSTGQSPLAPLAISDQEMPGLGKAGVTTRICAGGLSEGVFAVTLSTGKIALDVLPTRGMGLWQLRVVGDDEVPTIGWKSPVRGPVHPAFVDLGEPSGLGWLDGFDELLVRCGLESNGAPEHDEKTGRLKYPLHGRIANRPAYQVELSIDTDKQEIKLTGSVEESRFHFNGLRMTSTVTLAIGSRRIELYDEVQNFSDRASTMQMLYHVNFGLPLLDAGSRVVAPVKTLVPRNAHAASGVANWDSYIAPQPGFEEMVYFFELNANDAGQTQTLLKNAHSTRGVSLLFNRHELPCFSLWKDTGGQADGYVTGLEPGTNFPNPRTFEAAKGRVVTLGPGAKTGFRLALDIHGSPAEVTAAEAAIAKIQAGRKPEIHKQPRADWCA